MLHNRAAARAVIASLNECQARFNGCVKELRDTVVMASLHRSKRNQPARISGHIVNFIQLRSTGGEDFDHHPGRWVGLQHAILFQDDGHRSKRRKRTVNDRELFQTQQSTTWRARIYCPMTVFYNIPDRSETHPMNRPQFFECASASGVDLPDSGHFCPSKF